MKKFTCGRLRPLRSASFVSLAALAMAMPAFAQQSDSTSAQPQADKTASADDAATDIVVIGQRAMMQTAINRQRGADGVESVLTRDAIGQFPDQNVAEATRRLTGVNVLDDQGEGRFISVRGLDPSLNAASVNGVRLPAPEADTRSVALDVIASELIESIEVKKSLTPDMDADTIGASIEINTTHAFDRRDLFLSGTLEGSFNDLNGDTSPKASFDFSAPITPNFGIAGGLSYYDRLTSTDNMEMDDWSVSTASALAGAGVVYAGTVQYRDYDVERERIGVSLSADWRPTPETTLYVRGLYSRFDDTEKRQRLTFSLQGQPVAGDENSATFLSSTSAATGSRRVRVRRDLKDRFESQIIQSYQVGGETETGPWTLTYQLAYSEAEEHEHRTQDPTRFERNVTANGALGVRFDYSNLETTRYAITAGEAGFLNPSLYNFTELDVINGLSQDDEWSGRFDVAYAISDALELQGGVRARLREKTFSANNLIFDGINGSYTLADVAGVQSYGLEELGPLPDLGLVRRFNRDNFALFTLDPEGSAADSISGAYDVQEDIYAGYFLARYDTGRLRVIAGARVERTEDDLAGNEFDPDTGAATPRRFSNSYTNWLPSINVRYEAADDVLLRGALYASLVRPQIGDFAPRFSVNEDFEVEAGNPDLDPYRAWNFDISAEHYFAPGAVIQLGLFYKDIQDFIAKREFGPTDPPFNGVYQGIDFGANGGSLLVPINGDNATVFGVEFNYQQALSFLPAPWDGLLVGFNYTYTDAEGDIGDRTIPLPASAENTYNAMIGYEKGPLSLRVTAAYRDLYLDELGSGADRDRYVQDHLQIDASAKYRLNDNVQIYSEFVNLNDEPYLAYQNFEGRRRLLQFETYSWTAKFGLRLTY